MSERSYTPGFYHLISDWSDRSARELLPVLFDYIQPCSVIDVGCGDGTWLNCFSEAGVKRVFGLDGPYVTNSMLKIDPSNFQACDLENPPDLQEKFDLAICLEVAEHLSETSSHRLISFLTKVSDFVLFSAAIPHQVGIKHINLQWQDYWENQFRTRGFFPILTLRSRIWNNPNISFFYRQNIILYIQENIIQSKPDIKREIEKSLSIPVRVVHPEGYQLVVQECQVKQKKNEKTFREELIYHIKRRIRHIKSRKNNGK